MIPCALRCSHVATLASLNRAVLRCDGGVETHRTQRRREELMDMELEGWAASGTQRDLMQNVL
jgi:hypothetical protein